MEDQFGLQDVERVRYVIVNEDTGDVLAKGEYDSVPEAIMLADAHLAELFPAPTWIGDPNSTPLSTAHYPRLPWGEVRRRAWRGKDFPEPTVTKVRVRIEQSREGKTQPFSPENYLVELRNFLSKMNLNLGMVIHSRTHPNLMTNALNTNWDEIVAYIRRESWPPDTYDFIINNRDLIRQRMKLYEKLENKLTSLINIPSKVEGSAGDGVATQKESN